MFEKWLRLNMVLLLIIGAGSSAVAQDKTDQPQDGPPVQSQDATDEGTTNDAKAAKQGPVGKIGGRVIAKPSKYRQHVVVYIDKIPGKKFKPPKKHVVMDQVNLVFVPHVLPVLAGTTVDFKNSDNVLHNVFTPDACAEKFNLGSYPKEIVKSRKFDKPGCRPVILCNVHPEMEAWVVVLETPYWAVTDKDGKFTMEGVPPGAYTLKTWHKKRKPVEQKITVKENETTEVELKLRRR